MWRCAKVTIAATATATEMKNNFDKYLNMILDGNMVIITKNGKEVGRFIPKDAAVSFLTDSLTGILSSDTEIDTAKAGELKKKYAYND